MKIISTALLLAAVLLLPAAALAQQPGPRPDPAFERHLYPPELVMAYSDEIGLTAAQRDTIKNAIRDTQTSVLDLQWELQEQARTLEQMLAPRHVDLQGVLQQAERVMNIETRVKKAHLALVIEIKNALSAEQQTRLDSLRHQR